MKLGEPPHHCLGPSPPHSLHPHSLTPSPAHLSILPEADTAPGCTLVLVLMLLTVALSRTGAAPVPSAPRAVPPARGCHMAEFKSLSPQELQAFKTAKDAFVSPPTPPAVGEPPAPSCGLLGAWAAGGPALPSRGWPPRSPGWAIACPALDEPLPSFGKFTSPPLLLAILGSPWGPPSVPPAVI